MSARAAWLRHALCTDPADRPAAEEAITQLYSQLNKPPPRFVWVGSPAAALRYVPPPARLSSDGPWPFETRMASLVSDLRACLPRVAATDPLRRTVRESIAGLIRGAMTDRRGLLWHGQHEVDWVAHLRKPSPWATLARSCGWWWPREYLCVVSDRPSLLRTEPVPGEIDELRLHAADGPAVEYPDGWTVHAWHGIRVPSWVIDAPTVDRIAAEPNIEVRRCAIERIGWGTFIDEAGLTLVAQAADPGNPGAELRLYDLPYQRWGAPTRLLMAVNGSVERDGTRRRYGLRVPAWVADPVEAAGWSYGLSGAQYRQLQRRT